MDKNKAHRVKTFGINWAGTLQVYTDFTSLETTRRDWAALAKEFQVDLFTMLFNQAQTPALQEAVSDLVRSRHQEALYTGKLYDKFTILQMYRFIAVKQKLESQSFHLIGELSQSGFKGLG